MSKKVAIINYGVGNHFSVQKKLAFLGYDVTTTNDPVEIKNCDKIILPGVGHFGKAMENLNNLDLVTVLNEEVLEKRKPILGICLGMQLMAAEGEEGQSKGLNWFDAKVERFEIENTLTHKVPHTGWNQIKICKDSVLNKTLTAESEFYFVHSYHFNCKQDSDVLYRTEYESSFVSAVEKNNIYGVQFHPEKSHDTGLQLIKNFIEL